MKSKIVFISSLVALFAIASIYLFQTYAVEEQNDSYEIVLTGDTSIKLQGESYKDIIYQIRNTNNGTVKYTVGYSNIMGNALVKIFNDSVDPSSGLIDKNSYKNIRLRIENRNNEESEVKLSTILGFVNGGELNIPENTSIVNEIVIDNDIIRNADNELYFYIEELFRDKIESIEYKTFTDIPVEVSTTDISKDNNNSIRLWYTDNNENNLYEVYIASLTGKIVLDEDVGGMFKNIINIKSLDLLHLDTSNVKDMNNMFSNCIKLENIDLSSFNTSNVTNMNQMFMNCNSLSSLNIRNFTSDKLLSMDKMFSGCTSLNKIDLRNYSFSNIKVELDEKIELENETIHYSGVFKDIPNNSEIIVKDCSEFKEFTKNWGSNYTNLISANSKKCNS